MRFFKIIGNINSEDMKKLRNEDVDKIYQNRELGERLNCFGDNYRFFISAISESNNEITIGCAEINLSDISKEITKLSEALEISFETYRCEEITGKELHHLINFAFHRRFIADADEFESSLDLDDYLDFRVCGLRFGENSVVETDKTQLTETTHELATFGDLSKEYERIYQNDAHNMPFGFPVHYFIMTDDTDTRRETFRALIRALYSNGRVKSCRYAYFDLDFANSFDTDTIDKIYNPCIGGTVVVRFDFDSINSSNISSHNYQIEELCKCISKYRNKVQTIICVPREATGLKKVINENLAFVTFVTIADDFFDDDRAIERLRAIAKLNGVKPDKKLISKIQPGNKYLVHELSKIFDDWYAVKLKETIYPQYKDFETNKEIILSKAPMGNAADKLEKMIGLENVKKIITDSVNYSKALKVFKDKGLCENRGTMHMVFKGNPGTAKTTVARLFAQIMRDNGVLSSGHLVEVGRNDLVGKYIGWTAKAVENHFRQASGGVLFIDEAYSLCDDSNSFGDEAINTIVQLMENYRDDLVVIFAGYPDKMEEFLDKNPGLRSRIAYHVNFEDYSTDELVDISELIASDEGMKLSGDAKERLSSLFTTAINSKDFGNGRFARNVIEQAKKAHATSLLAKDIDKLTNDEILTITAEDIYSPEIAEKTGVRIGFCA